MHPTRAASIVGLQQSRIAQRRIASTFPCYVSRCWRSYPYSLHCALAASQFANGASLSSVSTFSAHPSHSDTPFLSPTHNTTMDTEPVLSAVESHGSAVGADVLPVPQSSAFPPHAPLSAAPTLKFAPNSAEMSATDRTTTQSNPQTITEGSATVLFAGPDAVFYNRVQILNRDMSICAIRAFALQRQKNAQNSVKTVKKAYLRLKNAGIPLSEGIEAWLASPDGLPAPALPGLRVLEALAASGLRSVRYAKEIPGIDTLTTNDFDAAAVASIAANMQYNGLSELIQPEAQLAPVQPADPAAPNPSPRHILLQQHDAVALMYAHKDHAVSVSGAASTTATGEATTATATSVAAGAARLPFDVVDLDPYGTVSPFLDTAVQSAADGALLCVTCTDMAVLAGNHMDSCHGKYGAIPLKGRYYNEQALRMVIASIESAAIRHKRVITPLLSLAMDFYVRIFVRIESSARQSTSAPTRLGHLFQCAGCDAYWCWPLGKWPGTGSEAHRPADKEIRKDRGAKVAAVSTDGKAWSGAADAATYNSKLMGDRPGAHVHANFAPPFGASCPHCDRPLHMGGPLWIDPIHDQDFVKSVLEIAESSFGTDGYGIPGSVDGPNAFYDLKAHTAARPAHDGGSNNIDTVAASRRRLLGILRCVQDELPDVPLHYELPWLLSRLHLRPMPTEYILGALRNAGFRVSGVHGVKNGLKTDAPIGYIWDVLRAWESIEGNAVGSKYRDNPITVSHAILNKPRRYPDTEIKFPSESEVKLANAAKKSEAARYIDNPGDEWGPGSRASAAKAVAVASGKSTSNAVKPKQPSKVDRRPEGEPPGKRPRVEEAEPTL